MPIQNVSKSLIKSFSRAKSFLIWLGEKDTLVYFDLCSFKNFYARSAEFALV